MTPEEIKAERESLVTEINNLRNEKTSFNREIDKKIDVAHFRIVQLRSKCIHSYAESKAAGEHWTELGLCTYCGESDY